MKAVGNKIIAKMDDLPDNVNGIALPSGFKLDAIRSGKAVSVGSLVKDVIAGDKINVRGYMIMGRDDNFTRDGVVYHVIHEETVLFVE